MKKTILCLVAGLAPFLLINPAAAADPAALKTEKTAEAKKPTLTFYYYPG